MATESREDLLESEEVKVATMRLALKTQFESLSRRAKELRYGGMDQYEESITQRYRERIAELLTQIDVIYSVCNALVIAEDEPSDAIKAHKRIKEFPSFNLESLELEGLERVTQSVEEIKSTLKDIYLLEERAYRLRTAVKDDKLGDFWEERVKAQLSDHNRFKNEAGRARFKVGNQDLFSAQPVRVDLSDWREFDHIIHATNLDDLRTTFTDDPIFDEVVYAINQEGAFNILNIIRDDNGKVVKMAVVAFGYRDSKNAMGHEEFKRRRIVGALKGSKVGKWLGKRLRWWVAGILLKRGYVPPERKPRKAIKAARRIKSEHAVTIMDRPEDDE